MAARLASQSEFCDTIPPAKLADPSSSRTPSPPPTSTTFEVPNLVPEDVPAKWEVSHTAHHHEEHEKEHVNEAPTQAPPRKLCVRHQRMADEGTNLKLQQVQ